MKLIINANVVPPSGFTMPENTYSDVYEMTEVYEWEWNKKNRRKRA